MFLKISLACYLKTKRFWTKTNKTISTKKIMINLEKLSPSSEHTSFTDFLSRKGRKLKFSELGTHDFERVYIFKKKFFSTCTLKMYR